MSLRLIFTFLFLTLVRTCWNLKFCVSGVRGIFLRNLNASNLLARLMHHLIYKRPSFWVESIHILYCINFVLYTFSLYLWVTLNGTRPPGFCLFGQVYLQHFLILAMLLYTPNGFTFLNWRVKGPIYDHSFSSTS